VGPPSCVPYSSVVAGGNIVRAELVGVVEKNFKFYFSIAQNIWIWRAAGPVLIKKMLKYIVPVLAGKIGGMQVNVELLTDRGGVEQVRFGRAVFATVILVPILHKQGLHLKALLLKKQGRDRRVDATGHTDNNLGVGRRSDCLLLLEVH